MDKRKVLFLDRDGVILQEPPEDYQIDRLDKFAFTPGCISALKRIYESNEYLFVMITNQDGLGTDSYPEETFWPYQNLMKDTLEGEGIVFKDIFIDKTFANDNAPTRKPGTALLKKYLNAEFYDLDKSLVIGDRMSDMVLAYNIGCKAIKFGQALDKTDEDKWRTSNIKDTICFQSDSWADIAAFILGRDRRVVVERNTKETQIKVQLNLDGSGQAKVETGLGFFNHMLEQIARHSESDLEITVDGDLHIDEHHTIEDTALALGEAFKNALGSKRGIERYGFVLPMDDVLAQVAIDFGGRPWIVWDVSFQREKVGDMPTEMFFHFFKSFSDTAQCNLNIKADGENEHHKIEAIFKAFAKAIKTAKTKDAESNIMPSTKGVL